MRNKKLKAISDKKYYLKNYDILRNKQKEYYQNNKDYIKKKTREYALLNSDTYREYMKKYYIKHRNKIQAMQLLNHKLRIREDKSYRLMCLLRKRIWDALNRYMSGGKRKSNILYGINVNTIAKKLLKELPKDFEFGKYHVDHIISIACFDLNDPEQLKECFKPENHQWLLAQDNLNKSDKILEEHIPIYNKLKSKLGLK
jgi:hypothetical protein